MNGQHPHPDHDATGATPAPARRGPRYGWLSRRLALVAVCAVATVLLSGWSLYAYYANFARERMFEALRDQLDTHRRTIELFLAAQKAQLQFVIETSTLADLQEEDRLAQVFAALNRPAKAYTDLGIISSDGRHLAYVGPYDLRNKNYGQAQWLHKALDEGVYISDMFRGFRDEPHFVIAVTNRRQDEVWILRATIDTDLFRSLVEDVRMGRTGEAYLLDRDGRYQTRPRQGGEILDASGDDLPPARQGCEVVVLPAGPDTQGRTRPHRVVSRIWLNEPSWLLTIQRDYDEAFAEVNHANRVTLVLVGMASLTILLVAAVITGRLMRLVRHRDHEAAELNQQLVQTGKLAALGELSAGVAHEINNPLAIILTERQLLVDELQQDDAPGDGFLRRLHQGLDQIHSQVHRCQRITHNLLRFARRTHSQLETVEVNTFLQEVVDLLNREAEADGIEILLEACDGSPCLRTDPSQLQQVMLNLMTNAMDAHQGMPFGRVVVRTQRPDDETIEVQVADTGCGIPPEHLARIFDPFFTTKPAGSGTGLGLAICYGIVERLGGSLAVVSEVGQGTTFTLTLPVAPPQGLVDALVAQPLAASLAAG